MTSRIADVLIPLALDTAYSYAVPDGLALEEGDVVQVPLATREVAGVVWGLREGQGGNFKKVTGTLEGPNLSPKMRKFLDWVSWYTLSPKGSALAMSLKFPDPDRSEIVRIGVRLTANLPKRMTPARQNVIETAQDGVVRLKSELAHAAGVSASVIDGLIDEGVLETLSLLQEPVAGLPNPAFGDTTLSDGQRDAAGEIVTAMHEAHPPVILLEGVTGSGKTEVYFEAVAEALRQGKQALILMPEIALTAQFLDRFAARFGCKPATWHSGVTGRKRERLYAAIASGEVKVVAGARSALFLPYANLSLIVVDEEHETAYKQDDGVHYHARDMAVVRGKIENAMVVLASATPSIESRVNVARGRYRHVKLPERFGGRSMPQIRAVDLRHEQIPKGRWLSPTLLASVEETVGRGEQALLFLNRRGYAPLTLCRACAHRYECPNCSAWLVEHRFRRSLVCHHCGHVERTPQACVECGSIDSLVPCGPGVERIAEEVADLFPDKRSIVLSSDFPGGTERLRTELAAIAAGEVDIVIGTQLVAKGHNFPLMTLVGVLDADIGLTSGDPRAAERTFQMLQQVTGRAGRGEKPGRALVQTWQPDHPVIAALVSGDAERFYEEETRVREMAGLPPFGRLASLIVSAEEREVAEAHARAMAMVTEPPPGVMVLGPAEAPLALIRGRYRYRLLVKTEREVDLQGYLRSWLARCPKVKGNTRVSIDVDPQSFL
ncbi:primosomal protein N' [Microvirga sp. G4-2]|uniref:primosomal protein N' n=1 Tax=Microvirga sp. G4-2 TaxID=3434467 RepID=UPI004044D9BD